VRLSWAKLLKRVFEIDLEHCPNCGGQLKIIAAILEQSVIEKILTQLGLQSDCGPGRRHARPPVSRSCKQPEDPPANTFQAAKLPGLRGPAASELRRAEVWRLIVRENTKATASGDVLRRCDRPSMCCS